jgi:hypothetical protein
VLHPHFGLSWFKKIGPDRAAYAKTLFEHVFARYQATHKQHVSPHTEKTASCATTGSGFFDDVAMIDIDDDEPDPVPQKPEYERFYSAGKTHGKGGINAPLAWWKVCALFAFQQTSYIP